MKRVSSWRSAGVKWARLEQSRAAALTPNTAATTRITRDTLDELSWERAKVISLAGGIAIYLVLNRLNIAYNIYRANRDISKLKSEKRSETEENCKEFAGRAGVCLDISFTKK